MQIVAFLDNDLDKQGSFIDGIIIDTPCNVHNYKYDYVILVGKYYMEMRLQLLSLGVDERKILDKDHKGIFFKIKKSIHYDVTTKCFHTNRKKIAMVMHSMTMGGASIALYSMARILKKHFFDVQIYADTSGEIIYDLFKAEIPVTVLPGFELDEREVEYYFSQYDCIIVNTIVLCGLVSRMRVLKVPLMWWLHEDEGGYRTYNIGSNDINIRNDTHVYGVGSKAMQAFTKYVQGVDIYDLHYGIEKHQFTGIAKVTNKIIFAVIGAVAYHKGQDILRKAVKESWNIWKKQAEFWILGSISDELRKQYENEGQIRIFGAVDHDEVLELMEGIDVVICTSRYDTMPIVLAEAMMLKKICITTDVTGTSDYIIPYRNGLICKSDDVQSLSEQIEWVLSNREKLKSIGEEAYKIYEKKFSEEIFEENIVNIIKNLLSDGGINEDEDGCTVLS